MNEDRKEGGSSCLKGWDKINKGVKFSLFFFKVLFIDLRERQSEHEQGKGERVKQTPVDRRWQVFL